MSSDILSQPSEDSRAMLERHNDRAHFWRLALGTLGLLWVCVLILLMR